MIPTTPDRIQGALYGALIGDALGVPYEFHAPSDLPVRHLIEMKPPKGFRRAHAGVPPGTWSDDGALLLALLDSLTAVSPFSVDDFAQRMLAWRRDGKYTPDGVVFDIGIQTRLALRRVEAGDPANQAGPAGEHDNGNGALMRVLPAAFMAQSDSHAVQLARLQGFPTHGHLWSQLACALYALVARRLLEGAAFDCAYASACRELPTHLAPEEGTVLARLIAQRKPGRGSGFVLDTLWSAFDCIAATASYEDAVRAAIALGHDTDTTACAAGGLAGALYGMAGVPTHWLKALRGRDLARTLLLRVLASRKPAALHLPPISRTPWWVERDRVMSGSETVLRAHPSGLQSTDVAADNRQMRANLSLTAAAPELFSMLAAIHAGAAPDLERIAEVLERASTPAVSDYWSDLREAQLGTREAGAGTFLHRVGQPPE